MTDALLSGDLGIRSTFRTTDQRLSGDNIEVTLRITL